MCDVCVDAVQQHWPDLTEHEQGSLLLGATCFPFGSAKQVEEELKRLAERTGCNLRAALALADAEMNTATKKRT